MGTVLTVGAVGEASVAVAADNTAERFGNKGAAVFATPLLVALMEQAAIAAIGPYLDAGQGSVGTRVEVSHLAATPVGMTVRARAELTEIAGKKLTFAVEAYDDREKVGEGRHERYIIDNAKFMARVAAKK
ncbi:thioesterase family protein [Anaeroselena agilis]|uniref:Thioesterase family protein n=1 Tax=Anaeroselena agilis TaxID=3063788 RepID=A0ABU3P2B7_9FIRM|nr:thioesterase family protein [Selenomonadales bacterium 4137-cl]